MAATRADISRWFDEAPKTATHMIVVCDEFDYGDYPEYIKGDAAKARECVDELNAKDLTRVMEVYRLDLDKETQLNTRLVFNY